MKKIFKTKKLQEAEIYGEDEINSMLKSEVEAKRLLLAFLMDDGRGHKHELFAKRFAAFNFKFVSTKYANKVAGGAPAWIQFEDRLICIQRSFLQILPEEEGGIVRTYGQLSVLLRHELIHSLLRHQIRMLAKFKADNNDDEEIATALSSSVSLHHLINTIEDFEISDRGYDKEDVKLVKGLILNGKEVGGLVVAIDEPEWIEMPVEEMYEQLELRIQQLNDRLNAALADIKELPKDADILTAMRAVAETDRQLKGVTGDNFVNHGIASAKASYAKPLWANSGLEMPIYDFVKTKLFKKLQQRFKACADIMLKQSDSYSDAITNEAKDDSAITAWSDAKKRVDKQILDSGHYEAEARRIMNTSPVEPVDISDILTGEYLGTIRTPEEKQLIIDMFKECAGLTVWQDPYERWFDNMVKVFMDNKYSEKDLQRVARAVGANN